MSYLMVLTDLQSAGSEFTANGALPGTASPDVCHVFPHSLQPLSSRLSPNADFYLSVPTLERTCYRHLL
ncbi:hypothetical protein PAXRUDRAFT_831776 [Paxillus rubicundulus Ve08.2h10]|uniref:Uncharacterized protein n=1 Tax=Paxillus rubicundulus Ve08.2h10 TaxID=930991 RepID=A0A0D0E0M0_9AGAM|nr:hypothetical protein PAXRUDRAFT_831776 [Paxillus rubicundulus Ve08.2h10]